MRSNGILLPTLFWSIVRKNCSSDQEKLMKFEAECREFSKILRSLDTIPRNELLCQLFRGLRWQWISYEIKVWHPWQLKNQIKDFFNCHGCQTFILFEIHCHLSPLKSWHNNSYLGSVYNNLFKQWKVRTIFGNRMLFQLVPAGCLYLMNLNN